MCGIVGYISKNDKAYRDEKHHFMRFALSMDTLRGPDSTGIMNISKGFQIQTMKTTQPGDRFVHSPKYKKELEPGWCCVGHNRAATRGSVKLENAHPFIFGDITMVHNGTLWSDGSSLPTYKYELEVDSMQIAHALAEHAPDEAAAVLKEVDGSFALVWFDARDKSINMARNADRPLHFGLNQARDMMWFMSDGHHLYSVNKSMGQRSAAAKSIYELDRMRHLKWKKGKLVPEVTKFDPFVLASRSSQQSSDISGKKGTALENATEKWKRVVEARGNSTKTADNGTEYPKIRLGGTLRKIPEPMLGALKLEFDVNPYDLLRFRPDAAIKHDNTHHMVIGTVFHEAWGDSEWHAVLYNAKEVQVGAYMDKDWLIRPVGITQPWERDQKNECPGVLCTLVHCDWKSYKEQRDREDEAADEGKVITSDDLSPGWAIGPGGEAMNPRRLAHALDFGCISCGMDLTVNKLPECMLVNNGQDVLCTSCVQDQTNDSGLTH